MGVSNPPRLITWVLLAFNLAACVFGWLTGEEVDSAFREEGFTTTISALQLALAAILTGVIFVLERGRFEPGTTRRRASTFWVLACLGFAYLAFDDAFMWHERIDWSIHDLLGMEETWLSDQIDTSLLVLAALIGFGAFLHYYRALRLTAFVKYYFWIGFALLGLSETLDVLSNNYELIQKQMDWLGLGSSDPELVGAWMGVFEESFKLLSEAGFLGAFIGQLWAVRSGEAKEL